MILSSDHAPTQDVTRFASVDATADPTSFVRFTDVGHTLPDIRTAKALIRQRLALHRGDAVLDVGSGPAVSLLEMAETVGPAGRLVGLDVSTTMISEARRRTEALGVPVAFTLGDAHALPFADETFDVCHAERLLLHVRDPAKVIGEMARVVRPGGRVGVFDFDHDTLVADTVDNETTRTIGLTFSDSIRNGRIGRQLPRLFKERGLVDVTVDAVPIFLAETFAELLLGAHCTRLVAEGILSADRMQAWWEDLRSAAKRGDFLFAYTSFIVTGVKQKE